MDIEYVKKNATASGECKENFLWYFLDGDLYIEGTGRLAGRDCWKKLHGQIEHVVIAPGCTSVGGFVFDGCRNLTSVIIPAGVTEIGRKAFSWCYSLKSVIIPEGVTKIGEFAFEDCWLLNSVTIPDCLAEIGKGAFNDCKEIIEICVSENNPYFTVRDRMLLGKDGTELIHWLKERPDEYLIWDNETEMDEDACSDCDELISLTIPEGVKAIGDYAFSGFDNLNTVIIPDGVTAIGDNAFSHCKNLTSVILPEGLETIGYHAFAFCKNLTALTVPNSVTYMDCNAFLDVPHIIYHGEARFVPDEYDSWNYNTNWGALRLN